MRERERERERERCRYLSVDEDWLDKAEPLELHPFWRSLGQEIPPIWASLILT